MSKKKTRDQLLADGVVLADFKVNGKPASFREFNQENIRWARWQRCMLARVASDIWDDLRPELIEMLSHVDVSEILDDGECKDGRDFPENYTPAEKEARKRMKKLLPYFAKRGGGMYANDWETIANQEGMVFNHGQPLDLDFVLQLSAVLQAKLTSQKAADEPNKDPLKRLQRLHPGQKRLCDLTPDERESFNQKMADIRKQILEGPKQFLRECNLPDDQAEAMRIILFDHDPSIALEPDEAFDEIPPETIVDLARVYAGKERSRAGFKVDTEKTKQAEAKGRDKGNEAPQYVTLDQLQAISGKSESWFRKRIANNSMPSPAIEGGGGKAAEWIWSEIHPWLQLETKRIYLDQFPSMIPG